MSQYTPSAPPPPPANPTLPISHQPTEVRSEFMRRVYTNLVLGIAAFIGIEFLLFSETLWPGQPPAYVIAEFVLGTSWLLILGGFMLVSWMATRFTVSARTPGAQWGGYGLLVLANALLFATPLAIAESYAPDGTIGNAALLSIAGFGVLSLIAMRTSKDFSFLRSILMWGGFLALGAIVLAVLTGTNLGPLFALAMIGFAGAAILYDTQKIYRAFPPGTEVIAAMHLFSSVALLFWYVLQLLSRR